MSYVNYVLGAALRYHINATALQFKRAKLKDIPHGADYHSGKFFYRLPRESKSLVVSPLCRRDALRHGAGNIVAAQLIFTKYNYY